MLRAVYLFALALTAALFVTSSCPARAASGADVKQLVRFITDHAKASKLVGWGTWHDDGVMASFVYLDKRYAIAFDKDPQAEYALMIIVTPTSMPFEQKDAWLMTAKMLDGVISTASDNFFALDLPFDQRNLYFAQCPAKKKPVLCGKSRRHKTLWTRRWSDAIAAALEFFEQP